MAPKDTAEIEVEGVRGYPARVQNGAPFGDSDALLQLAKERAIDPTIFDESQPFFWSAQISNNSIDSYSSRMMPSSLKNYAADAEAGVAFQNSHIRQELPLGGSLAGRFVGGQGNGASRVEAAFFTIPDLQLTGLATNEFIRGVRSGVIKDVSIGFWGGRSVCSICKSDMWDWMNGTCVHWPGEEYDIHDNNGKVTGREIAIEQIEDAHLAEVSAVYDGATPGAVILKARAQIEAGNLKPDVMRRLESRYRINLPGARLILPGHQGDRSMATDTPKEEVALALREGEALDFGDNKDLRSQVAAVLSAREIEIADLKTKTTATNDERVARLEAEVERLRPLADDGTAYRSDLIEDALSEGVRAHGSPFPKETQRALLEKASISEIKTIRDSFKAIGNSNFKGGRQTIEATEEGKPAVIKIPAAAFAV